MDNIIEKERSVCYDGGDLDIHNAVCGIETPLPP